MEIEEFTGLVHLTEKLGLITPPIAEEVLAHIRSVNGNLIDPKILIQNNIILKN